MSEGRAQGPGGRRGRGPGRGREVWRPAVACLVALALASLAACAAPAPPGWQSLGYRNQNGMLSLADDPTVKPLIYAGAAYGAVYRARADTSSSPVAGAGLPDHAFVGAILPDPRTSGLLYAGTSAGFYVSSDHGDHWQPRGSGLPAGDNEDALALAPQSSGDAGKVIVAGTTEHGVYRSADGGATWTPASAGLPANADVNALFAPPAASTLYAALDNGGVYASTDGARSWVARGAGLPKQVFAFAALTSDGATTLLAGTSAGLFATTDGGAHWSGLGGSALTGHVLALATDPVHPGWLYAGTDTAVYRSQDAGRSWSLLGGNLGQPVVALLAAPASATESVLFAAADYLYRYPAYVGRPSSPLQTALSILALLAVFAVCVWVMLRNRRLLRAADIRFRGGTAAGGIGSRAASPGGREQARGSGPGAGAGAEGLNGHHSPNGHRRPTTQTRRGEGEPRPGVRDDAGE